ncbi:MAG TPA: DUF2752 domain-containing protein [Pirellulales bacterium]|nr:DUF2752 domain-containing protein [Pirellulales bacterium]
MLLAIPLAPRLLPAIAAWPHACLSRELFGVACPGCGVTTSIGCLAQMKFAASYASHPGGMVLTAFLVIHLFLHALALRAEGFRRSCNRMSRFLTIGAGALLAVVWLGRLFFI